MAASSNRSPGWTAGEGIDDRGVIVAPGFLDLHAHLREPGNEAAETVASGLAAAAHGGFIGGLRDAQHDPAHRQRGGGPGDPGGRDRVRLAGATAADRCRDRGPGGGAPRAARRAGRRRRRRVQRRRLADPRHRAVPERPRLRRHARRAAGRPPRGPGTDRRRRGARRPRLDRPRPARLARRRGGERGRARHRGPGRGRPRRARRPGCT